MWKKQTFKNRINLDKKKGKDEISRSSMKNWWLNNVNGWHGYNKANRHLFASFCEVSLNQKGFKRYAWRVYKSEPHLRNSFAMILSLVLRRSFMSLFFLLFPIFPSDSSDRIITDFALSSSCLSLFFYTCLPQSMRRTLLCESLFLRTFSRFSITYISNAGI